MTTVSIDQTELYGQGAAESERINESAEKQKSSVEFAAFGVSGSLTAWQLLFCCSFQTVRWFYGMAFIIIHFTLSKH